MFRANQQVASDEIPLSPIHPENAEINDHEHTAYDHGYSSSQHDSWPSKPASLFPLPQRRPTHSRDRHVMFLILVVMSLVFLALNVVQIGLIFTVKNIYWLKLVPAVLFIGFLAYFAFEAYRRRAALRASWDQEHWETRIAWIGIVATVFLNIIACEFGYINGEALDVASSKIWKTSLDSVDSLPPPALALVQDSFFKDRGVLVSDSAELNTLYELHKNATEITNQRSFNNFTSRMSPSTDTPTNFVFFDGNYKQLKHGDDLDLYYEYYVDTELMRPTLGLLVFDPKFLKSDELFFRAMDCGIVAGVLFDPAGRSQVSLEQVNINDKEQAFEYDKKECNNQTEFRDYSTYRITLTKYAGSAPPTCLVNGTEPPPRSEDVDICTGDVDIRFSTMLVTSQTSSYRKNWIDMLTDEGGIIGGIMFVTWFMGILNQ